MTGTRTSRELRWPDLVWSHFSRPRFDPIDARVEAAAAAGFAGIGLFVDAWRRERDGGRSIGSLADTLDRAGIVVAEIEALRGWWATEGAAFASCRDAEAVAFELADALGVRYLQAIGPYDCGLDQAIEGFASLCDRAGEHGLLVGIEWLPFTNIATEADAAAIVEGAGRVNGGYCADIWHHRRGADDVALLRALDPTKIFAVQMNDGPRQPVLDDYKADCMAGRVLPGEGDFDCVWFVGLLAELGVTAPISIEVCSEAMWTAPVEEAARACADAMREVLSLAEIR